MHVVFCVVGLCFQVLALVKVKVKVKQSLYTPWRRMGGEEV
jgi:hypothetical protein